MSAGAEVKAEEQVPADRTEKVEHNYSKLRCAAAKHGRQAGPNCTVEKERLKYEDAARRQDQEQQGRPLMSGAHCWPRALLRRCVGSSCRYSDCMSVLRHLCSAYA